MSEEFGERIAELSRKIKAKEAEKAKIDAGISLEKERLKKEFGISDLKTARDKLKKMEEEIIKHEEALETEVSKLEEDMGDG